MRELVTIVYVLSDLICALRIHGIVKSRYKLWSMNFTGIMERLFILFGHLVE